jgi:hypothetical protein
MITIQIDEKSLAKAKFALSLHHDQCLKDYVNSSKIFGENDKVTLHFKQEIKESAMALIKIEQAQELSLQ